MNLSREHRLLLYCAQTEIPEDGVARLDDLLSHSLDWEYIGEVALSRNIAELLYHNLKGLAKDRHIPPEVMERLKKAYHENVARNTYLYAELRDIAHVFDHAGVEAVALKGAALAGTVYRDAGLRRMRDIDLLVREDDLQTAQRMMTVMGYAPAGEAKSEKWCRENHFHLPPYRHRTRPAVVEIHWNLSENSSDTDVRKFWKRARIRTVMGCRILVPSPEDMLIHLCIHLYNHGFRDKFLLRGLSDIFETLRHYEADIDWGLLRDAIKEQGIEKQVHSVLCLVKKFYDRGEKALRSIRLDYADHRFLRILERSLFRGDYNVSVNSHLLRAMLCDNLLKKSWYLLCRVFVSPEEMSRRYPVSRFSVKMFFCYLVRPFHLMAKYGSSLVEICKTRAGGNERE